MFTVSFPTVYLRLLRDLLQEEPEENKRTGSQVRTISGGVSFHLDLSDYNVPTPGIRRVWPKSAAAELAWYLMGTRNSRFIRLHTKMWDQFLEEDRETIKNAYGYRWRYHFGRDQIKEAIELLRIDPSSRQAVISAWDPSHDGLLTTGEKNVPCPTQFTFNIVRRTLHSSVFLRSSDVFVGLPYDVMGHAMLSAAMAKELSVDLGTLHVTLAHAHLYEVHAEVARETTHQEPVVPHHPFGDWTVSAIMRDPAGFTLAHRLLTSMNPDAWPTFNPKVEVVP